MASIKKRDNGSWRPHRATAGRRRQTPVPYSTLGAKSARWIYWTSRIEVWLIAAPIVTFGVVFVAVVLWLMF